MFTAVEVENPTIRTFGSTRVILLLLCALLALIALGILADESSALTVPAGGFNHNSGTYVYDAGNTVAGNLLVSGTATVTLDGVTITFTSSYQIRVDSGAHPLIKN